MQAAALVALVALSPLLIEGSVWIAVRFEALTAWAVEWLASPFVLAGVVLWAFAALATKWARVW